LRIAFFQFLLPEGEAFGESSAVPGAGKQLEEERRIFFREGSESARDDGKSIGGIIGDSCAAVAVGFIEPCFEFGGEFCGGLIAVNRASCECFEADALEFSGDAAAEVAKGAGRGGDDLAECFAD
jgi:hypothetical protein